MQIICVLRTTCSFHKTSVHAPHRHTHTHTHTLSHTQHIFAKPILRGQCLPTHLYHHHISPFVTLRAPEVVHRVDSLDPDTLSPNCLQSLGCPFLNHATPPNLPFPSALHTSTPPQPLLYLHMEPGEPNAAPDGAPRYHNRQSCICCKAASPALTVLCPLSLYVRLIHIDVQKLGTTRWSWLNSCRPPTAVRDYTQSVWL